MSKKKSQKNKKPNSVNHYILMAVIVVITFFTFSNALENDFVNWDDDKNFLEHPAIKNLSAENFWEATKTIFTTTVIGNYNPLSNFTFAIEKLAFGFEHPFYWHLNNVLLHIIAALLVYRIALLLQLSWKGSLFLALLFAVHPLKVESVTWVTERKDVLFGVFYLAAIYQYLKIKIDGKKWRWIFIFVFFILSLFSKIQAVTLPLSLIAIDYYQSGNLSLKNIINKIPLFILSLLFGLLGIYFLSQEGSLDSTKSVVDYNLLDRIMLGTYAFSNYLIKSIVPFRLSPIYPYIPKLGALYYVSLLVLPLVVLVLWKSFTKNKVVFFGLSFFIVNIIFLLQIFGAGQAFIADRFSYISFIGLFFIPAYYFDYYSKKEKINKLALYLGVIVIFGIYIFMSRQQNAVWKNSETLWTHVIDLYPNNPVAWGNRASNYKKNKQYELSLKDYNKAIALNPNIDRFFNGRAEIYFNLATDSKYLNLAIEDYNKAIAINPNRGEFFVNRGTTYAKMGMNELALKDIEKGLQIEPNNKNGWKNKFIIDLSMGNLEAAIKDAENYLKLDPFLGDMWLEKGKIYHKQGNYDYAIADYSRAIKENSRNGLYYYQRAKAWYAKNEFQNAKNDLSVAVQLGHQNIDPNFKKALGL